MLASWSDWVTNTTAFKEAIGFPDASGDTVKHCKKQASHLLHFHLNRPAEADALLAATPFDSHEQRLRFQKATANVPGEGGKGKPSHAVLAALHERRALLHAVLEEVTPESRQMLERVLVLRKKAKKQAGKKAAKST